MTRLDTALIVTCTWLCDCQNTRSQNTQKGNTYTSVKLRPLHIIKKNPDYSKWDFTPQTSCQVVSGENDRKVLSGVFRSGAIRCVGTCSTESKWLDAVRLLRMAKWAYSRCLCQHVMGLHVLIRKGKSECHNPCWSSFVNTPQHPRKHSISVILKLLVCYPIRWDYKHELTYTYLYGWPMAIKLWDHGLKVTTKTMTSLYHVQCLHKVLVSLAYHDNMMK